MYLAFCPKMEAKVDFQKVICHHLSSFQLHKIFHFLEFTLQKYLHICTKIPTCIRKLTETLPELAKVNE